MHPIPKVLLMLWRKNLKMIDLSEIASGQSLNIPLEIHLSSNDISLTSEFILQRMGYVYTSAPEPIPEMVSKAINHSKKLIELKAGLITCDQIEFLKKSHSLKIRNNHSVVDLSVNPIIFNQLKNADGIITFLCTAGANISKYTSSLMGEGEIIEGYIYDVIGSEWVEATMDKIQEILKYNFNSRELKLTNRFSPGYCTWNIKDQKNIFKLFPNGFCNVTLSASCLMNPVKSISGIIGYGKEIVTAVYPCSICSEKECLHKRHSFKK